MFAFLLVFLRCMCGCYDCLSFFYLLLFIYVCFCLFLFVFLLSREYNKLQQQVLQLLQQIPLQQNAQGQVEAPPDFINYLKNASELQSLTPNEKKEAMAFASYQMRVQNPKP